jgi:hypothetical protein
MDPIVLELLDKGGMYAVAGVITLIGYGLRAIWPALYALGERAVAAMEKRNVEAADNALKLAENTARLAENTLALRENAAARAVKP